MIVKFPIQAAELASVVTSPKQILGIVHGDERLNLTQCYLFYPASGAHCSSPTSLSVAPTVFRQHPFQWRPLFFANIPFSGAHCSSPTSLLPA
jgi:hypothetical protein